MAGRRRIGEGERERREWQEFDHQQKIRAATDQVDPDTSFVRLSEGPPPAPAPARVVRVSVPGRGRVAKRARELVGVEAGVAVWREWAAEVPDGRMCLDVYPDTAARLRRERDAERRMVLVLPARWTPEDVLGWLEYAHAVLDAAMHTGRPIRALSGLARLMAQHGEVAESLVDAPWVPTAGEISLATWVARWTIVLTAARERIAVAMRVRGESLRAIGRAIGLAEGDTNQVKKIIRQGLGRVACKIQEKGPETWPRLRDVKFRVDGSE